MSSSDQLKWFKHTPSVSPHTVSEGMLLGGDMLWLRRMVREEVHAALEAHREQGHEHLMQVIEVPADEQNEVVAVLAEYNLEQLEELIQKVRERKLTDEREPYNIA